MTVLSKRIKAGCLNCENGCMVKQTRFMINDSQHIVGNEQYLCYIDNKVHKKYHRCKNHGIGVVAYKGKAVRRVRHRGSYVQPLIVVQHSRSRV